MVDETQREVLVSLLPSSVEVIEMELNEYQGTLKVQRSKLRQRSALICRRRNFTGQCDQRRQGTASVSVTEVSSVR